MFWAGFLLLATFVEGFHYYPRDETDPCACLEWQEVYSTFLAHCGDGYEYFPAIQKGVPKEAAPKYLEQSFCKDFFQKLDDNECVNMVHDNTQNMWYSGKTWCWVPKGCPMVSEEAYDYRVHAKVKFCSPGDLALGHFLPSELEAYSQDHDLDIGLLSKFAYPVEHSFRWNDFKGKVMDKFCHTLKDSKESESMLATVNGTEVSASAVEQTLKAKLIGMREMAQAAILVNDGLPPFGVITLKSVWEIWGTEPTKVDPSHPVTESKMYCLCGDCK